MKFLHRHSAIFFLAWVVASALASGLPAASQTLEASVRTAEALPVDPSVFLQSPQQPAASIGGVEADAVIEGVITDARGALVPGAALTLERKGHAPYETSSDSAGHFIFNGLAAGSYTLLISAPELKTYFSPAIALAAGQTLTLPPTELPVATANTSITVSANSTEVAEQELNRETQQRVLGIIPNFYTSFVFDAAPLNARQKFKLTTRTLIDPVAFLGVAITAGIETSRDTFPSWGQDGPSYGKRFAAAYGDELLSRGFSYAIYPAIFHQDPRYFYMGPTYKTSTRFWHAVLSGIVTRGDNGRNEPNYSHMLGTASAGALSSVYHPASDSAGYLAALNFSIGLGSKGGQALVREFILPHFTTHVPKYAKVAPTAPSAAPAPADATKP